MEAASLDHFDIVLSGIRESSGRTRTALYIFMVANFALFLTVYGADLYRRPIERLNDFLDAVICLRQGLPDTAKPRERTRLICRTAKENAQFAGYDFAVLDGIPLTQADGKSLSVNDALIGKRLEVLITEEVASKRVQIPFVGFTFEIDYLWLLTSFFGPLGMIVITASLRSELEQIQFAKEYLGGPDPSLRSFRARLLLSSQVLLPRNSETLQRTALLRAQRIFVYLIFLLPVLTQAILIFYDGFIINLFEDKFPNWRYFWDEFSADWMGHPVFQTVWLITVSASSLFMILSIFEFHRISLGLREQYAEIGLFARRAAERAA
jgi:hypothetical protein